MSSASGPSSTNGSKTFLVTNKHLEQLRCQALASLYFQKIHYLDENLMRLDVNSQPYPNFQGSKNPLDEEVIPEQNPLDGK